MECCKDLCQHWIQKGAIFINLESGEERKIEEFNTVLFDIREYRQGTLDN